MKFVYLFLFFSYGFCDDTVLEYRERERGGIIVNAPVDNDSSKYTGVTAIYTQVSTANSAGTNDNVNAKICDSDNNCCNVEPLSAGNILKLGKLSTIPGEQLGQCVKAKFKRENLQLTLTIDGSDSLKIDWIRLRLASGEVQTCQFNEWISTKAKYPTSLTSACQGKNIQCPEVLVIDDKDPNGKYNGKYDFYKQINGKPAYRHEADDFYISYENGWEVYNKAPFESPIAHKILTSSENVNCPLDIKMWTLMGKVQIEVGIYGTYDGFDDVNHIIQSRGHCEKDVEYSGSSIESIINVKTVAACDLECEFDPRCSYFRFDVTTYTCRLFQVFDEKVVREFSISGLKGCSKKSVTAGRSLAILEPHMITGLGLAIKSAGGYYWSRHNSNGYVYLDHQSKSRATRFLVEKASDDSIYLKGESGKYLTMTAHSDGNTYMKEESLFPSRKSELEVIPHKGKVAFRLKENAKFLKDAADSAKNLIAKSTSLEEDKALFSIETGSVRDVTEKIVEVTFHNTTDYSQVQPSVVQSKTIVNKGSKPVEKTMKMAWQETSVQSTTWEHNWALGASISTTAEFDIGFFSLGLTISYSADYGGSHTKENEETNTLMVGEDTKVVVPANKRVKADLMLKKIDNADLFFTAKIVRESDVGVTTFYQDGVWRGVVVLNSFVTITEEEVE